MRWTRLLSLLAALALVLMACQPANQPGTADAPATTDTPATTAPGTPATDDGTGEDVDEAVLERLATAAANTVDEGTARFEIVAAPGTDTTGRTGTDVTVRGEVDFDGELRELELPGPQGELTAIVDGSELYVELPAAEEDQYARIDLDELSDAALGPSGPAGVPFQDPLTTLEALRDAVVEARALDAADSRHLFVVVDLERAGATGSGSDHFSALVDEHGIETIDMEVWIDEEDRIERIAYLVPLSEASLPDGDLADDGTADTDVEPRQDLAVTITYSDFGAPVDIEVPGDDRVIDLDEQLLRQWLPRGTATPAPGTTATPTPTPAES